MPKLKIGRYEYNIGKEDLILDNGACYQVITQKVKGNGMYRNTSPKISKKLFNLLIDNNCVYTNKELTNIAKERFISNCILYKFDLKKLEDFINAGFG